MSATLEATRPASQKKTFGKSTREIPHHSQKAKKWYPAEDEVQHKKVRQLENQESIIKNCWTLELCKPLGAIAILSSIMSIHIRTSNILFMTL
jgi:hypothetical protein